VIKKKKKTLNKQKTEGQVLSVAKKPSGRALLGDDDKSPKDF